MSDDGRAALKLAADTLDDLPRTLTAERRRRGLSQEKTATQIGVGRQTVRRWETGQWHPRWSHVPALLRWLAGP